MTAPHAPEEPEAIYHARRDRFAADYALVDQRWNRLANLRLALFLSALLAFGLGVWRGNGWLFGLAGLLLVGFVAIVVEHTRIGRVRRRLAELQAINTEGIQRLARAWHQLPLRQAPPPASLPPFAGDLDLLGHASLQHLLNTANTPVGQTTLQHWLLQPADPATIRLRQTAVAELAPQNDLRDELAVRGRVMGNAESDFEAFLRWAEGSPWFVPQTSLVWITRLLPVLTLATLGLWALGIITLPLWLPLVLINLGLTLTLGRRVDATLDQVAARQSVFRAYADLFALVGDQQWTSPALRQLQTALSAEQVRADQQMQRLGRIMAFADFRLFMFYFPIQLLTLWNVHVLVALEHWQQHAGTATRGWLVALGEIEALTALATLAHDQPAWTFPKLRPPTEPILTATAIGHPLLAPAKCVVNDVELGPPGTFVLVTGSNMSGKSTLLRSIGLNVVLAQAGAPVCATLLQLPPLALATSMRVQDSLEAGVSYFMAELQRLKSVVDAAHDVRNAGQRTLLFLLDEILHGTNTTERQIAARQIIRHLVAQHAIGAVSTHDLGLANEVLSTLSRSIHFTETFSRNADGPVMHFDYKIRPGLATSTNALKLMEIVGLPLQDDPLSIQP